MEERKFQKTDEELARPVTLGVLLEYTDTFLIPTIAAIVRDATDSVVQEIQKEIKLENASMKHELKVYVDEKLNTYTSDIFIRLDKKYQKEKQFKEKVIEILERNQIGSKEDLAFLKGLI